LLLGCGVSDVDGGVDGIFGFVGGVDCVGQFALASTTDPSAHVFVVGEADGGTEVNGGVPDVDGGVVVDGVNVCVHDGSFGFFVQSTGGGVLPEVQLPAAHVDPELFPPDVVVDVLFGGIGDVVTCSFASPRSQSLVLRFLSGSVLASLSARSHGGDGGGGVMPCSFASRMSQSLVLRFLSRSVTALLSLRSHFMGIFSTPPCFLIVTVVVSCTTTFITVGLLNKKLAGTYTVIATICSPLLKF
jgi:hypothetical protein